MSDDALIARLSRIHRQEKIDASGRGEVWTAQCDDLGPVCVKMFTLGDDVDEAFVLALRRAVDVLPQVDAAGLPKVYDGGVLGGAAFLVMEHLHGQSLASLADAAAPPSAVDDDPLSSSTTQRLAERGQLTDAEVLRLGRDWCAALAALHDVGVVHGDVQLQHLFVTHDGSGKLLGAGTRHVAPKRAKERSQLLLMAPERLRGAASTAAADVYSVGVALWRLRAGQFMHDATSPISLISQVLTKDPDPLDDDVDDGLRAVLQLACAKDVAARGDAAAVADACGQALDALLQDDEDARVVLDLDGATAALQEQLHAGAVADVVKHLDARRELALEPAVTEQLWQTHADALLHPLYEQQHVPRSNAALLAQLPQAIPDLIAVATDWENSPHTRTAAVRILGLTANVDVVPYLARLLEDPSLQVQRAAHQALVAVAPDVLLQSAGPGAVALFDGDVAQCTVLPENQRVDGVDRLFWPARNVEVLPAKVAYVFAALDEHELDNAFRAVPSDDGADRWWGAIDVLSAYGEFGLLPFRQVVLGSGRDCDVVVDGLAVHHAVLEVVGPQLMSVRTLLPDVDDEQVLETWLTPGMPNIVSLGDVHLMTRDLDDRVLMQIPDGRQVQLPTTATAFRGDTDFRDTFDVDDGLDDG